MTPAQAAGIDIGFQRNKCMELLKLSLDGNVQDKTISKPKRLAGFILKVWDEKGKELSKFQKRKFKTEFGSVEKAKEFLHFYEQAYPDLVFFVDKKFE